MPNLFSKDVPTAVFHGVQPALLSGIEIDGISKNIGMLVTGVAISQGVRVAYFTTLSESIYIYPLGNKVGKCVVTGIALPSCTNGDAYSNLKKLMDFYDSNKGSNFSKISKPVKVTIGGTVLAGILEDMQVNITNESHQFGSATFSLMLSVLPEVNPQ